MFSTYKVKQIFIKLKQNSHTWSNMSKTSASVSSGVPDTEKQMKARGRRLSAFIVSRCLEPLMKHEAQVFDMTSQTSVRINSGIISEK